MIKSNGKVVIVGDGSCGKTCLLEVFIHNIFPKEYLPTVVDNFVKTIEYEENKTISLSFWDTAGQEDYDTIRPLFYRETDFVILSFSIDTPENLSNIELKWLMEIKNYCPNASYILVGLKSDLRDNENFNSSELIEFEKGKALAEKIKALDYIECSALTRKNVDYLFKRTAKLVAEIKGKNDNIEGYCSSFFWCC